VFPSIAQAAALAALVLAIDRQVKVEERMLTQQLASRTPPTSGESRGGFERWSDDHSSIDPTARSSSQFSISTQRPLSARTGA
jgi:hypothetical protein